MSDWVDDVEGLYSIYEGMMENRMEEWKQGFHTTQNDEKIELKYMSIKHLENTIEYFKNDLDVRPLQIELKKRYGK